MSENRVVGVSIVDRNNEQVFYWTADEVLESTSIETIFFCALDIIEEKKKSQIGSNSSELYLGYLTSVDDYCVLGYLSNTQVRVMIACVESASSELYFKDLTLSLASLFVRAKLNPFQAIHGPIKSDKFKADLASMVKKYKK